LKVKSKHFRGVVFQQKQRKKVALKKAQQYNVFKEGELIFRCK